MTKAVFVCLVASLELLLAFLGFSAALVLSVQFDGSLRPPSDSGFSTASLGRIGTAAAALCLVHDDDNAEGKEEILLLGGEALPHGALDNSAEAEYEGLLMGLEKAVKLLPVGSDSSQTPQSALLPKVDHVLVQGDCKTVIDQLKESSRPRKLETHFLRAQGFLDDLKLHHCVEFQHVPREQNKLCDGLCTTIRTQLLERAALHSVIECIDKPESDLVRCLREVAREGSLIPFSKRPPIYSKLVSAARERDDNQLLVQLGEQMEHESKTVWASAAADTKKGANHLQAWAVALQLQGYKGLGTRKSLKLAAAKERKNRFLLSQYSEIMEETNWGAVLRVCEGGSSESADDDQLSACYQTWLNEARSSMVWRDSQCLWVKMVHSCYEKT